MGNCFFHEIIAIHKIVQKIEFLGLLISCSISWNTIFRPSVLKFFSFFVYRSNKSESLLSVCSQRVGFERRRQRVQRWERRRQQRTSGTVIMLFPIWTLMQHAIHTTLWRSYLWNIKTIKTCNLKLKSKSLYLYFVFFGFCRKLLRKHSSGTLPFKPSWMRQKIRPNMFNPKYNLIRLNRIII